MSNEQQQEQPTEQEIRSAIAEWIGWRHLNWDGPVLFGRGPDTNPLSLLHDEVPDYSHSLEAMHEVESELERRGLRASYLMALHDACGVTEQDGAMLGDWKMVTATAAQRALAAYWVIKGQEKEQGNE